MSARALAGLLALCVGCAGGSAARDPIAQDPPFDAAHPARAARWCSRAAARACSAGLRGAGRRPASDGDRAARLPGQRAQPRSRAGHPPGRLERGVLPLPRRVGERGRVRLRPRARGRRRGGRHARAADFAARHRIDPSRLALVGHSMGGFAALLSASELPAVDCAASLAGANLGSGPKRCARPRARHAWPARSKPGVDRSAYERRRAGRRGAAQRGPLRPAAPRAAPRRQAAPARGGSRDEVTPPRSTTSRSPPRSPPSPARSCAPRCSTPTTPSPIAASS